MKKSLSVKINVFLMGVLLMLFFNCAKEIKGDPAKDWTQFKKDNFRSANASVSLDLETLGEDWKYMPPQMPSPAWYGPAKEDTYARSGPLPSMRDYDLSYYPIIVEDKLFYGSSSDHAIHCLDTKTGEEEWTYTTGGPIRVAPVFHSGKLFFGSDDGYAYCIKANTGKLVWKYAPVSDSQKKVINNNALISFWPIRTGVLIENNIAYFGASLLPWKDSYFCALNIETGKPEGAGTYIKKYENLTLEGAMASTGSKIIQPQGRISPIFFDKKSGENKGQLAGTGGCFVLVTPEKNIVHPNNTRAKGISETIGEFAVKEASKGKKNADYMSFKDGKEMVVSGDFSYILTDNSISVYNRKTKKVVWLKRNYKAHRIIISDDVLYVGATDTVYAVSVKNGYPLWQAPVKGAVYALAVADNALFASTGEGYIYCFRSGKNDNALLAQNADKPAEIDKEEKLVKEPELADLELVAGPFTNTIAKNSVEVQFVTQNDVKAAINWGDDNGKKTFHEGKATKNHRIVVDNLRKDFIYEYQIMAGGKKTRYFEFDNFFNYEEHITQTTKSTIEKSDLLTFIEDSEVSKNGFAIIFGTKYKEQALQLTSISKMKVLLFDTSESKVQALREALQKTGVYGSKITVHHVTDLSKLPITDDIANVVVVNDDSESDADEVIRLIKPNGYAILNKKPSDFKAWLQEATRMWQVYHSSKADLGFLKKAPYENVGTWTHQYGLANNSAFGGESLWGSTGTDDFEIQWMGRPGPRFQTDRSGRKPSPLAVNGKMFVQGRERVIAVDAYNGNVFWSKELPGFTRMNIIRDCSNWVADDDFIYTVISDNLIKINNKNGNINAIIPVEKSSNNKPNDWGYISVNNNSIIGSSVPKGSHYTNYYGNVGWYDGQSGPLTDKVVSYTLFAKHKKTLDNIWIYENKNSYIINSTITISGNTLSFVESRNSRFTLSKDLRADPSIFKNLYMVSLNTETGKVNWEKPINTAPGVAVYYMAGGKDYNVLLASNSGKYYIYTFHVATGELVWKKEQKWFSGDHGGHLSKPAMVNNRLIVKPVMYTLDTGELLENEVPKAGHGCASYALSEQSAFYRGGSVTQFNFDTNKFSQWERLRPDCWISTIPAQGLVLSPEAGGGCSCGNWLETSMVFTPKSRAPISFIYDDENFTDKMSVEIKSKDASNKAIYYSLDGSEPTNNSIPYTKPVIITEDTQLKAVIYVKKGDQKIAFFREKAFKRVSEETEISAVFK